MFKEVIKKVFTKYSYKAVCYAEELLGSGNGKAKKEIAIDFLISKLPIWLRPFSFLIKSLLTEIADDIIEIAVRQLHYVQENAKKKLEQ